MLCFGAVVLPISAYSGAAVEALYVLPTELCGSKYEATCQSAYLSADIEWYDTKGLAERKSLETLVSKPTFYYKFLAPLALRTVYAWSPLSGIAAKGISQVSFVWRQKKPPPRVVAIRKCTCKEVIPLG